MSDEACLNENESGGGSEVQLASEGDSMCDIRRQLLEKTMHFDQLKVWA